MPTTLANLPRDVHGAIEGQFRLRHRNPAHSEGMFGVGFRDGLSINPVTGPLLMRLVAACGADFDVEPWEEPSAPKLSVQTSSSTPGTDALAESAAGASVCSIDDALIALGYRVRVSADGAGAADVLAADGSALLEGVDEDDVRDWLIETGQYDPQTQKVQQQSPERVLLRDPDDDEQDVADTLPDDPDALRAVAESLGIPVTKQWRPETIKKHIRKHQGIAP